MAGPSREEGKGRDGGRTGGEGRTTATYAIELLYCVSCPEERVHHVQS